MKTTALLLAASVVCMMISGCEQKKNVQIGQPSSLKSFKKHEKKKTDLMIGEKDQFNPNSQYESIRKQKLTGFGRLQKPALVAISSVEEATKILNAAGIAQYNVLTLQNKSIDSPVYPFDYENDITALKKLYDMHNLGSVVRPEMSELERLQALMVYTNQFLRDGRVPTEDEKWSITGPSAFTITKLRQEQGIGGTSEHYAALFCQLSLACGFNSRLVSMHTLDENGNFLTNDVCEVFLNTHDKWAVFDAYNRATYYIRNSVPLDALELRILMLQNRYREIIVQPGIGDFADFVTLREDLLPRYQYLYLWRMNDMLSRYGGKSFLPWQALYKNHLVWEDEYSPVSEGSFDRLDKFNRSDNAEYKLNGVHFVAHEQSDFYWTLNHVVINFTRTGDETIRLYLDTMTPNFDSFQILQNTSVQKSQNRVELRDFVGDIFVRSVNKFGVAGPFSELNIIP
ncbi:hypothetical protein LLG96_07475 [bacterium]|nr:hypothetical protein [bacterium]